MIQKTVIACTISILFVTLTVLTHSANAVVGAIEDGLVGYWSFDKNTVQIGKHAEDIFSGLTAVVKGDPELAPASDCKVGECILFDGTDDNLLVEDTDPPKIDRDWDGITLECWVYITALDDSWNRIISLDDQPTNSAVASLYYDDDDNQHGFFIRAGGQETKAAQHNVLEDIPLEQWIHLVGTYDGTTVHYYVNGKQEKKYAVTGGKLPKGGLKLAMATVLTVPMPMLFRDISQEVFNVSDTNFKEVHSDRSDSTFSENSINVSESNENINKSAFLDRMKMKKSFSIANDSYENLQSFGLYPTDHLYGHYVSRSLDFETVGSRRAILQRCCGASFSKSFDTGSSSISGSISSQEQVFEDFAASAISLAKSKRESQEHSESSNDLGALKSESNVSENQTVGFLDIDLSDIDKYLDMSDIQALDTVDDECDDLEKFIDSFVEVSQKSTTLSEKEHDQIKIGIPLKLKLRDDFEDLKHDENSDLNDENEVHEKKDDYIIVKGSPDEDLEVQETAVLKENMPEFSEGTVTWEKDVETYTYRDVKIKTFQLGKNSINMRTFGNYSCSDKNKNTNKANENIVLNNVDTRLNDAVNNCVTVIIEEDLSPEEYKDKMKNTVVDIEAGMIHSDISSKTNYYGMDEDSEEMKKIKAHYEPFSYGNLDIYSAHEFLKKKSGSINETANNILETFEKNVTFEEVFAQNFEYLENELTDEEDHSKRSDEDNPDLNIKDCIVVNEPPVHFVTHNCLNCGHQVTVATHVGHSYQKDHDFCVKCSPLDISVECLERKRREKYEEPMHDSLV